MSDVKWFDYQWKPRRNIVCLEILADNGRLVIKKKITLYTCVRHERWCIIEGRVFLTHTHTHIYIHVETTAAFDESPLSTILHYYMHVVYYVIEWRYTHGLLYSLYLNLCVCVCVCRKRINTRAYVYNVTYIQGVPRADWTKAITFVRFAGFDLFTADNTKNVHLALNSFGESEVL